MKIPVAGGAGVSPGCGASATDVAAGGGVKALWRDHNNAPAATSATASSAIHHQCHRWRDSRRSASITGSVMSQMLLAGNSTHLRDCGALRSQLDAADYALLCSPQDLHFHGPQRHRKRTG